MKRANEFDAVMDCQAVFRLILEAASNPGRVVDISATAARLQSADGVALALAATLVDNETAFAAVGNDGLSREIELITGGRATPTNDAGYLFVEQTLDDGQIGALLERVPCGTLEEPHRAATVFVRVGGFPDEPGVRLAGPGIGGSIRAPLCGYALRFLVQRAALALEYPCGIDLVLYTGDGRLLAVPRLVKPVEGMGA